MGRASGTRRSATTRRRPSSTRTSAAPSRDSPPCTRTRGSASESEKAFREAMARIDRMSEREKYRTRGAYYIVMRQPEKAIEQLEQLVKLYPPTRPASRTSPSRTSTVATCRAPSPRGGARSRSIRRTSSSGTTSPSTRCTPATSRRRSRKARAVLAMNPTFAKAFVAQALSEAALGRRGGRRGHVPQARGDRRARRLLGGDRPGGPRALRGARRGRDPDPREGDRRGPRGQERRGRRHEARGARRGAARPRQDRGGPGLAGPGPRGEPERQRRVPAARVYLDGGQGGEGARPRRRAGRAARARRPGVRARHPAARRSSSEGKAREGDSGARRRPRSSPTRGWADTTSGVPTCARRIHGGGHGARRLREAPRRGDGALPRRRADVALFPARAHYELGRARQGLKSPAAADSFKAFLAIRGNAAGDPLVADARRRLGSK